MGYVLYDKMQVFPQFNSALIWLTKEEQSKFQYVKGDTEGIVNYGLSIKGIVFAAIFIENKEEKIIKDLEKMQKEVLDGLTALHDISNRIDLMKANLSKIKKTRKIKA